MIQLCLSVNEHSEDSYMGRDDCFFCVFFCFFFFSFFFRKKS